MTSPQREWRHLQRRMRGIPVEQIATFVASFENDGCWCLVSGDLVFVQSHVSDCEITLDDELVYAQLLRYVQSQPERIHPTLESAREFVRSQLSRGETNLI